MALDEGRERILSEKGDIGRGLPQAVGWGRLGVGGGIGGVGGLGVEGGVYGQGHGVRVVDSGLGGWIARGQSGPTGHRALCLRGKVVVAAAAGVLSQHICTAKKLYSDMAVIGLSAVCCEALDETKFSF